MDEESRRFNRLCKRKIERALWRFVRMLTWHRHDREDYLQSALMRAWEVYKRYQEKPERERAALCIVSAKNLVKNLHRGCCINREHLTYQGTELLAELPNRCEEPSSVCDLDDTIATLRGRLVYTDTEVLDVWLQRAGLLPSVYADVMKQRARLRLKLPKLRMACDTGPFDRDVAAHLGMGRSAVSRCRRRIERAYGHLFLKGGC